MFTKKSVYLQIYNSRTFKLVITLDLGLLSQDIYLVKSPKFCSLRTGCPFNTCDRDSRGGWRTSSPRSPPRCPQTAPPQTSVPYSWIGLALGLHRILNWPDIRPFCFNGYLSGIRPDIRPDIWLNS